MRCTQAARVTPKRSTASCDDARAFLDREAFECLVLQAPDTAGLRCDRAPSLRSSHTRPPRRRPARRGSAPARAQCRLNANGCISRPPPGGMKTTRSPGCKRLRPFAELVVDRDRAASSAGSARLRASRDLFVELGRRALSCVSTCSCGDAGLFAQHREILDVDRACVAASGAARTRCPLRAVRSSGVLTLSSAAGSGCSSSGTPLRMMNLRGQ